MSRKPRCRCRIAAEGDYDVARGHAEVGDTIECAGHYHLRRIRQIVGSKRMSNGIIGDEYDGDPQVEAVKRLRRLETRFNKFARFMGYTPSHDGRTPENVRVLVQDGKLYATSPLVTMGELCQAAATAQLHGDVELYVGGHHFGTVRV